MLALDLLLQGSLEFMMGEGGGGLVQKLRAAEREKSNTKDRDESLLSQVDASKGVEIEARDRYRNTRDEVIRGLNYDTKNLGKYLYRSW